MHLYIHLPPHSPLLFLSFSLSLHIQVIQKYSDRKPTLVFCESKKSTETLAQKLSTTYGMTTSYDHHGSSSSSGGSSSSLIDGVQDSKLKGLLRVGLGYHHAGLTLV